MTRYLIIAFAYLAVIFPLTVRLRSLSWDSGADSILLNLFPTLGIVAFCLLWLHSMSGVFEPWLRKYLDFDRFVRNTALIIFFCIILHPLLLLIVIDFKAGGLFSGEHARYIWLGAAGWLLLITYDTGKLLQKKYDFFVRHWNSILAVSTIGFLLIFFHSLNLGSDLQSGILRKIWIFYGLTAIIASIYTYGVKRFIKSGEIAQR